ncbi:MAG: hypothetical protein MUP97_07715, partial [Acidimicrobiia bacterium]|nr:hypothetical protein [Acidimicrobiia bacterium]
TGCGGSASYTHSLEDAIDGIHHRIGQGVCKGFEVVARMRADAEKHACAQARHAASLARAQDLLGRLYGADPSRLVEQLATHVDLVALARAIEAAEEAA